MLSSTDQHEPVQQGATAMGAWARRLLFLRIILITVLLIGILFWLSSKVIVVLLILLVAALLAYAVVPVIDRLHRFMPRVLAMVLVYLVAIALFGFLAYITVKTLIPQLNSLAQSVQTFVTPGSNGQESPLDQTLKSLGFTQSQINSATKQLQSQLSSSASDIAKGTEQLIGWPDQRRVQHLDHRGSKCLPAGRWLSLRQLADRQFTALPTRLGLLGSRDLTARGGWLYPRADHHVDLYGGDAVCRHDHPRGAVCRL